MIQCLDEKSSWEHKQPHSNATGWSRVIENESMNQNVAPWIKSSLSYPTNKCMTNDLQNFINMKTLIDAFIALPT